MTESEFHIGMDMLVDAFRPYRWRDPDNREIYWRMLSQVDGDTFIEACKRIVITDEEMPSVAKMTQSLKRESKNLASCSQCDRGRIHFAFYDAARQQTYERYCACTCDSGLVVADRMAWMVAHAARQNGSQAQALPLGHYQWPEVKMRLGGAIREERHNERMAVEDVVVPEDDGTLAGRRRRKMVQSMKAAFDRAKQARERARGRSNVDVSVTVPQRTTPDREMAF